MSKTAKRERLIYAVIMMAFVIAGFFFIINSPAQPDIWENYYIAVFADKGFGIYGNVILGVPLVGAVLSIILNLVEISMGKYNFGIEYTCFTCYSLFFAFGLIFASIAANMFPFGMLILGLTLALAATRVIFHFGLREQKI